MALHFTQSIRVFITSYKGVALIKRQVHIFLLRLHLLFWPTNVQVHDISSLLRCTKAINLATFQKRLLYTFSKFYYYMIKYYRNVQTSSISLTAKPGHLHSFECIFRPSLAVILQIRLVCVGGYIFYTFLETFSILSKVITKNKIRYTALRVSEKMFVRIWFNQVSYQCNGCIRMHLTRYSQTEYSCSQKPTYF